MSLKSTLLTAAATIITLPILAEAQGPSRKPAASQQNTPQVFARAATPPDPEVVLVEACFVGNADIDRELKGVRPGDTMLISARDSNGKVVQSPINLHAGMTGKQLIQLLNKEAGEIVIASMTREHSLMLESEYTSFTVQFHSETNPLALAAIIVGDRFSMRKSLDSSNPSSTGFTVLGENSPIEFPDGSRGTSFSIKLYDGGEGAKEQSLLRNLTTEIGGKPVFTGLDNQSEFCLAISGPGGFRREVVVRLKPDSTLLNLMGHINSAIGADLQAAYRGDGAAIFYLSERVAAVTLGVGDGSPDNRSVGLNTKLGPVTANSTRSEPHATGSITIVPSAVPSADSLPPTPTKPRRKRPAYAGSHLRDDLRPPQASM